jgi:hypothetical protein
MPNTTLRYLPCSAVPHILPPRTYPAVVPVPASAAAVAAAAVVALQRIARAASQFLESEVIHPNLRGARALIAITSK